MENENRQVDEMLDKYIVLNNGVKSPQFGLGLLMMIRQLTQ